MRRLTFSARTVALDLKIPKIVKTRLSDKVLEALVALIQRGHLKQGDRLPTESELAAQLGVGRSSVREAIGSLTRAGILEVSPRRGTRVASPIGSEFSHMVAASIAYWSIRDFYELRILLEAEAAGLAAERATPHQLELIKAKHRKIIDRIRAGKSWFDANSEFHSAIAKASGNTAFVFCLSGILGSYRSLRETINQLSSVPKDDIEDHGRIVDALCSRNRDAAAEAMRIHLRRTIEKLEMPR